MEMIDLNGLFRLSTEPLQRALRAWWIAHLIRGEYRNLAHFQAQVENGHRGISDSMKRIVNLEHSKGL
jgi:hypothetical protein